MTARHDETLEVERYELSSPPTWRFELERRTFLAIFATVGSGLLVAATQARGQESGRPGSQGSAPTDVKAWVHVSEDGRITGYTGKTEIGQNIRTSLAQAIADELHVPLERVSLVMADTDLVPFDQGTFGSLSTPRMAPVLARAAATAREMLIDRAAAQLGAPRASLTCDAGQITGGGRSVGFGDLVKGRQLTGVVPADAPLLPRSAWKVRGAPAPKVDGRRFVTGEHRYTPDLTRPGMLHGRMLRPPGYTGTLTTVDDSAARGMDGVTVVRDGTFAGVVASSARLARRAAAAIKAEWTVPDGLPTTTTLYDHLKATASTAAGGRGSTPTQTGDPAKARTAGARTFTATYRIPYIAHVPLEPRAAVAEWEGDKLTVWTGTQRPFGVRSELATAFRIPEDRVRVIVPDTGSAYGGKHTGEQAVEAARLAKAVNRPVKVVYSRPEEFSFGYLRPAGVIEIAAAVDAEGRLTAWEFDNWNSGGAGLATPYDVPNVRTQFHAAESPLRQGSYRGLASTANHHAREMHMDAIARALGADAVEYRLRHLTNDRMRAVLQAAARGAGWPTPSVDGRGLGIACGTDKGSYIATAAEVSRTDNVLKVERLVVAYECGAIVNPEGLRHQVEGAIIQGLGGALFEAITFANGAITNGNMAKYRVPRFKDVPSIELLLLDRPDLPSVGAGETPIVCVAPAIGSAARAFGAVADALPVRFA
ncbi:molybdopterin cofactor-binding domain-containing protein [Luteitalea sp.]